MKIAKVLVYIASIYFIIMASFSLTVKFPQYLIYTSLFSKLPIITYDISVVAVSVLQLVFAAFCLLKLFFKKKIIFKILSVFLFIGAFIVGISTIFSFILDNQMTTLNILIQNAALLIGVILVGISTFTSLSSKIKLIVSIVIPSVTVFISIFGLVNITFNYSILLSVILMIFHSVSLFVMLYHAFVIVEEKTKLFDAE